LVAGPPAEAGKAKEPRGRAVSGPLIGENTRGCSGLLYRREKSRIRERRDGTGVRNSQREKKKSLHKASMQLEN